MRMMVPAALLAALLVSGPRPAAAESLQPPTLVPLVARLLPAVVNISSDRMAAGAPGGEERKRESLGSGFIVDPDGIIITNNHVISGAYEITVTLHDNTALKARLIAASKVADVAVLKVNYGKPLPTVRFGDDEKMQVGDPVIAIGNPLGLGGSVSVGIISALNRNIQLSAYDDFIQTDAAINHGNSGGPLFDMNGDVIGMNTAIISPSMQGGSVGLGFAQPATNVQFVSASLRKYGRIRSGWLSMHAQDVTPDIAEGVGLSDVSGAIITGIIPDGAADKAGLKPGDIVRSIGARKVTDTRALMREVAVLPLASTADVGILRDGRAMTVRAVTDEFQPPAGLEDNTGGIIAQPAHEETANLGLQLQPLTDYMRGAYGLKPDQRGVLITGVDERSVADDHGLLKGDVITRVQEASVSDPKEVQSRFDSMRKEDHRTVLMLVEGKEGLRWVSLPLRLARGDESPTLAQSPAAASTPPAPISAVGKP